MSILEKLLNLRNNMSISLLKENMLIFLVIFIAVILILSSFLNLNKRVGLKKSRKIKYVKIYKNIESTIEKIDFLKNERNKIAMDIALITHKSNKRNKEIANYVIYIFVCISSIVIFLSFTIMKYFILKVLVSFIIMAVIISIFNKRINKLKRTAQRSFANVLSVYTRRYAKYHDIHKAFHHSISAIPNVHKYEFSRLLSSMTSITESEKALREYAERVNTPLCTGFVDLLIVSLNDSTNLLYGLIDLEHLVAQEKKAEKRKINHLSDKKANIRLAMICSFGGIFFNYYLIGDAAIQIYFNTFLGQAIILSGIAVMGLTMICMEIYDRLI